LPAFGIAAVSAFLCCAPAARAQPTVTHRGSVAAMMAALPDVDATELRVRLDGTVDVEFDQAWVIRASSWIDALAGSRRDERATDLVYQPGEIYARYRRERFDVTAGFQRVVWGTLDEVQPTDVVNPLDVSRFLFEGRSEARLPVLALRARLFLPRDTAVDAVYVPVFRPGRYDLLDEETSPFNLRADSCRDGVCTVPLSGGASGQAGPADRSIPVLSRQPARTAGNGSVGVRATRTVGGVDVGVSAWRGWQAFPLVSVAVLPPRMMVPRELGPSGERPLPSSPDPAVVLSESWSRITMIGADAEAARGAITWRAEGAFFVDTQVQAPPDDPAAAGAPAGLGPTVDGRSLQVGAGLDWTTGPWRTFGNVIVRRSWAVGDRAALVPADGGVQLVGGVERTFARDTRRVRAFAVVDPPEGTAFVRGLGAWNVRDNLWLEGSAAWFAGQGSDFLGRYTERDFVSVRVKYYF
jgi:hypothetical protein